MDILKDREQGAGKLQQAAAKPQQVGDNGSLKRRRTSISPQHSRHRPPPNLDFFRHYLADQVPSNGLSYPAASLASAQIRNESYPLISSQPDSNKADKLFESSLGQGISLASQACISRDASLLLENASNKSLFGQLAPSPLFARAGNTVSDHNSQSVLQKGQAGNDKWAASVLSTMKNAQFNDGHKAQVLSGKPKKTPVQLSQRTQTMTPSEMQTCWIHPRYT